MNKQLVKPESNDKIVELINTMVPEAHRESAKLLMEENKKKDIYIADLELQLKDKNEMYSKTYTKLEEKEKYIEENEAKVFALEEKEKLLTERDTKITLRETNQNHHDEISQMKVNAAQAQQGVIADVLHTIFKPPALRTEIHKTIPMKKEYFSDQTRFDKGDNGYQETRKTGEDIVNQNSDEDRTETEE